MAQRIKITKTQTVTYDVGDQDAGYYQDHGVVNIHQAALADVKDLEEGGFTLEDIDGDLDDAEYKVVLVDDDGNETPVDKNDTTRDEYFPDPNEPLPSELVDPPYVPETTLQ